MPWVNVFDVGACRVEVYESGPVLIPEGDYAARGITVSTAGGVVSLTCASEVISLWEVRVVPSFATADLPVRLGAFAGPVYRAALWLDGGILDFANLTPAGDAYTPDPAQLSPPWNAAGIRTASEAGTGTVSFVVEIEQAEPVRVAQIFVYSMTQTGNVGAWSRYTLPYAVDAFAQLGNDLLIRSGDSVYRVAESAVDDAGVGFDGTVQWNWLDMGQPGVTKMLEGFDVVSEGVPSVSIGYDQRDRAAFTEPYAVAADTLPGGIIPLPVSGPSFSMRVDFAPGEPWELSAATLYMHDNRAGA
jgi:hypothetical protein